MESLSYAFEGRAMLFTDDTNLSVDGLVKNKNPLRKWDREDTFENMGFTEPRLPHVTKNSFLINQCLEICGDDTNHHLAKSIQSASTVTLNSLMELDTRFSSSANKAIDEEFSAPREYNRNPFSVENSVLSSPPPSVSVKRSRITYFQSPVPACQVHGCNKDLSSSKDYHKRHKVCDVHSKTPVVIVNGIQQRFCQQCSRFHILAEFDEGKRSCRKRLAGHNERRRKPKFDTHLSSTYFTTDASKTSLIFSRVLPTGFFGLQYNEPTHHAEHLKVEEDVKFGQSLPKSVLRFHRVGKQYPSKSCLNAPTSLLPEITEGSNSSSALSLLSARYNSEGLTMAHPMGELTCGNFGPIISGSSGVGQEQLPVSSEAPQAAHSLEPNTLNLKSCLSSEGSNNVNLFELSLHLQKVEEQRYYGQVKLENGFFCDSTIA